MSTRHQQPGGPFRQERYASAYELGLMGNLVAKRCAVERSSEKRELIWFLQWLSWEPGSLGNLPPELAEQAPAWCLDPRSGIPSTQFEALASFRSKWTQERAEAIAHTSIGKQVCEALSYCRSAGTMCLIDGPSRIGKSFAARAWCDQSAGIARYVEVPSSTDDTAFLHRIAKAIGVSSNLNSKAMELRARVEDTLQGSGLMLVLDEAHYLWPQGRLKTASAPYRLNWINTALANAGVPVALITTPQFYTVQRYVEKQTGWNSDQFVGRLGHVERLPERLERSDLLTVAASLLPEGSRETWCKLAIYAELSQRYLASIEAIVKRARWLAARAGRSQAGRDDVDRAIDEGVIPSDSALAVSLRKTGRVLEASPGIRDGSAQGQRNQRGDLGRGLNQPVSRSSAVVVT